MASATVTTASSSTASFQSSPYIETVYDDDDSSYEEYVIEEVIEYEDTMADDEKKADGGDHLLPPKMPTLEKMLLEKSAAADDCTIAPPAPPATGSPKLSAPQPAAAPPRLEIAPAPFAPPPLPPSSTEEEEDVVPVAVASSVAPPLSLTPSIPLTPSKQRAKAASSAGLSELSKQLRVLHAKSEAQSQDISRLERQLRILADLQGISVGDLRKALEEACASEAFGELQNRVQKLKYELEAATLAKQQQGGLRKDTTAPRVANLELRVGELEEVEERQAKEIHHLYEQLRQERAKSTRLESENAQLKKELEDLMSRYKHEASRAAKLEATFQDQIRKFQEDQTKKMQEQLELARQRLQQQQQQQQQLQQQSSSVAKNGADGTRAASSTASSTGTPVDNGATLGSISPEMAVEYERMVKALKDKDEDLRIAVARLNAEEINWVQKLREVQEAARKTQAELQVEYDKLALTVKELEDADGQNGLRLAQYKARFQVQDERIDDLEQQLDSLYTAFTLLKEEFDSENQNHKNMLSNLNDADAEIARQANVMEKKKSQRGGLGSVPLGGSGYGRDDPSVSSIPRMIATPTTQASTPSRGIGYETPSVGASDGIETPTPTYASAQAYQPSPGKTSSTWQLLYPQEADVGNGGNGSWLIHGPLIVESKGMLRKWKTKASKVYLRGEHYQWEIGSKQSWPLQFGISKVEFNPNYALSFVVYLNPNDATAPVIRAATSNERDYQRWLAALTKATSGEDYLAPAPGTPRTPPTGRRSITTPSQGRSANRQPSFVMSSAESSRSIRSAPGTEDQEAADLQRVLELSKHET